MPGSRAQFNNNNNLFNKIDYSLPPTSIEVSGVAEFCTLYLVSKR